MSKHLAPKQCDIFTRARRTGAEKQKAQADPDLAVMADTSDVLPKLKSLRTELGTKLDGIEKRLTEVSSSFKTLEKNLTEIKNAVTANEKRIDDAEDRIVAAESRLDTTDSFISSASKRLNLLEAKMEDLENRSRRKNLRLFGLREGAEGSKPLMDFIKDMLPQWLDMTPDTPFSLERVHRTLAPAKPNQHRAVLIRFLKFQEKELVFRSTRRREITYDGNRLYFSEDFSAETMRQRREFNNVRKLFADKGMYRGFLIQPCKLRILHDKKIYLFSSPKEAEEFYRSVGYGVVTLYGSD
ncbi:LINE-1 type transposase domain-containing 1 [Labeo rohita]|uniref:LINE-1 type transposase domain-containing 1 n=1 Tax=Labeo rohita TaxID=84645 RepID=A0A498M7R4_LABRO|nr:LINE-1 type transposase domain-containing 1 [Labeo rohita]